MALVLDSKVNSGVTTNTYRDPDTKQEVLTITWEDNKIISIVGYLFDKEDTVFTLMKEFGVTAFDTLVPNEKNPNERPKWQRVENNNHDKKDTPLEWLVLFRQMIRIHPVDPKDIDTLEQMASIVQVLRDERAKLNN